MPYCPECSASTPDGADRCPTCDAPLVVTPATGDSEADAAPAVLIDTGSLQRELANSVSPQYEILRPLGVGGMGAVYLAKEPALKRLVAIKVLAPHLAADARARARFEREARAAAALSHPNVVRVFAVGETATRRLPYIVMQYVEGLTLTQCMLQRTAMSERPARRVIGEIASALAAAHARSLVHRDVKPSNVLIEDETGRAFVADFGVSAAISPRFADETKLTATGAVVGTPAYMSPEQASAERITPKSDVYSLGVVAYELLVGEPPFQASTAMGWAAAHLRDTPTPVGHRRPEVAPDVARLVDRCLAKEPAERPEALEIARGLLPTLEAEIDWPPPGLAPLGGRIRTLNRLAVVVSLAAIWTLAALAFTPDVLQVHANWLSAYQEVAETTTRPMAGLTPAETAVRSLFLWQNVTLLGAATFLLSLAALLVVGLRTAGDLLRHRGLGWRSATLLDVLVDHDGRTGLLVSGTRELASLEEVTRRRVRLLRRLAPAATQFASAWLVGIVAVWLLALATGFVSAAETGAAFGSGFWYLAMVPALAALGAAAGLRAYEDRLMRPTGSRRAYEARLGEVTSWYQRLPSSAPNPTPPRAWQRPGATLPMRLAAGVAAALVAIGLVETAMAALIAGAVTQRLGPRGVELRAILAGIESEDPLGQARAMLAGYLPPTEQVPESLATAWARSLTRRNVPGGSALPDYRAYSPLVPSGNRPDLIRPAVIGAFGRARLGRIRGDTLVLLDSIARHPRTELFRRLARAPRADLLLAGLDRPLAAYESWFTLQVPNVNELRRAALANTSAAILEVARGDLDAAAQRLGETGAVVEHLLTVPTGPASEVGLRLLANHVLWPLAEVELMRGDARRAQELRSAARGFDLLFATVSYAGAAAIAADPDAMAPYRTLLESDRLPVGWRVELFPASWFGLCTNPREILLGPSAARRETVLAAAAGMREAPHTQELARLLAADLESPERGIGTPPRGFLDRAWRLRPWRVTQVINWCSSM